MKIETASEHHLPQVRELFEDAFGEDAAIYPLEKAKNLKIMMIDEQIIGAGALFSNSLHANFSICAIAVRREFRRRGIGRRLHESVVNREVAPNGVDGCCYADNLDAIGFLTALNYQPYLDCVIPIVDTSKGIFQSTPSMPLNVLSFSEMAFHDIKIDEVLRFLVKGYCDSHQWSPVTIPEDSPTWEKLAFDRIDQDLSVVGISQGQLVGVSTAAVEDEVLEIQWSFAPSDNLTMELEILRSLIAQQLSLSHERGIKTAALECDSASPGIFQIAKDLSVLSSQTWRRFRFKS